jgi:hypothetical protein
MKREVRRQPRRRLVGLVPGELLLARTGKAVTYISIDVSAGGLGIESTDEILPEIELLLQLQGTTVALELVWGHRILPGQSTMRYGLKVKDPDVDLEELLAAAGF